MSLHDALHRVADDAPLLRPDTGRAWTAGRRRHHRRTAACVVAAAASIALVAGLVGLLGGLPGRSEPPVAGSTSLGVPDRLYAVPDWLAEHEDDGGWSSSEVSGDLAPGRGAVAFVTAGGLPVVVGAADGAYHLLDLPGFLGNARSVATGLVGDELTVALSPDGRSLAYGWARVGPAAATEPVPSGVAIVDLETGALRTIRVDGLEGTQALRFSWSPDGRWLAWAGRQLGTWTERSVGSSSAAAGRIAPGATTSVPVPGYLDQDALAVDQRGRVLLVGNGGRPGRDGFVVRSMVGSDLGSAPAVSASGLVAVGGRQTLRVSFTAADTGPADGPGRLRPPRERTVAPREDAVDVRPVGWLGDAALVRVIPDGQDHAGDEDAARLLLVGPSVSAFEVARVDPEVGDQISVATDLMTLRRPTVTRPAPDWPWSTQRWVVTGAGLLAAGLVLVVAGVLVTRSLRRGVSLPRPRGRRLVGFLAGLGAGATVVVALAHLGILFIDEITVVTFGGLLVAVGLLVATTRRGLWLGLGFAAAVPLTYAVLVLTLMLSIGS